MHIHNRQLFLQSMAQTSPEPLLIEMVSAKGHYLQDIDGKNYLDLISGISVSSLGHGHPKIVEAVKTQAESHMHLMVYGELVQSVQVKLATLLTNLLPPSLNSVFLVNSGSEAVEGAMKLAKRFTGKTGFVAHTKAYHGSTQGALSLMDESYFTAAFRPLLPGVKFINQNDIAAIAELGNQVAAVIVETVQAEKGAIPCDVPYLKALRKYCNESGALLIFDEIQTGMGRTGSLFSFEQLDVIPDVLLLGKAFGGGMPLAAFVASSSIMSSLSNHPVLGHITTFGGHPVSCAAAFESLQLCANGLDDFNIHAKSALFKSKLVHPKILKTTGMGLLLAVHLESESVCKILIQHCLSQGVFSDWFLHAPHCLRIAPPLTITEEEIGYACNVVLQGLNSL